jgi:hypothetical protein
MAQHAKLWVLSPQHHGHLRERWAFCLTSIPALDSTRRYFENKIPFIDYATGDAHSSQASYIILASIIGTLAFTGLAALPISSAMASAALLFLANLEVNNHLSLIRKYIFSKRRPHGLGSIHKISITSVSSKVMNSAKNNAGATLLKNESTGLMTRKSKCEALLAGI